MPYLRDPHGNVVLVPPDFVDDYLAVGYQEITAKAYSRRWNEYAPRCPHCGASLTKDADKRGYYKCLVCISKGQENG